MRTPESTMMAARCLVEGDMFSHQGKWRRIVAATTDWDDETTTVVFGVDREEHEFHYDTEVRIVVDDVPPGEER